MTNYERWMQLDRTKLKTHERHPERRQDLPQKIWDRIEARKEERQAREAGVLTQAQEEDVERFTQWIESLEDASEIGVI